MHIPCLCLHCFSQVVLSIPNLKVSSLSIGHAIVVINVSDGTVFHCNSHGIANYLQEILVDLNILYTYTYIHDGCYLVLKYDHCFHPTECCSCGPIIENSLAQPAI